VVRKDTLPLRPEQFFIHISHRIAAVWLRHNAWHSIPMRHKCKFGRNQAVTKRNLFFRTTHFYVPIPLHSAAVWLKPRK
jgi:hypothetical protein